MINKTKQLMTRWRTKHTKRSLLRTEGGGVWVYESHGYSQTMQKSYLKCPWNWSRRWDQEPLFWGFQFYTTFIFSYWDHNKSWQVAWNSYQWCVRNRACYEAMVKNKISVLLQIIPYSCVTLKVLKLRSGVEIEDRFPHQPESDLTYLVDQKNSDQTIKQ